MARTCGIRLGSRRAELLVLEGSAKKPKVRAYRGALIEPDATGTEAEWTELLKEMSKEIGEGISSEDIGLAVDSGLAVFRHLSLPFAEKQKIEEVLKFEVESKIPQWNIDDVICDFHVLSGTPVESHLLVTAVPKQVLSARLTACSKAGLEPFEAELDATALFMAAEFANVMTAEQSQLLVYLGEASATFVVVSDRHFISTRAFHFEVDSGGAKLATAAVAESGDVDSAFDRKDDEDLLGTQRDRRRLHVTRLRREVARTLSSVSAGFPFNHILVCGSAANELIGTDIAGVPVSALDPFADVAGAELIDDRLAAVVVFGAALRRLGYPTEIKPHLRREELSYAGTFERLELPLGVLGLLLAFFLGVHWFIAWNAAKSEQNKLEFYVHTLKDVVLGADPERGDVANAALRDPPPEIKSYLMGIDSSDTFDPDRDRYRQIRQVDLLIAKSIGDLKEKLGAAENASYPQSALWAAQLPLDMIDRLSKESRIPRFAIRGLESQYLMGANNKPDRCEVSLNLTVWGETSVQSAEAYDAILTELRSQVWLVDPSDLREPSRVTGADGTSLILDNLRFYVNPDLGTARYLTTTAATAPVGTSSESRGTEGGATTDGESQGAAATGSESQGG